MAGIEVTQAFSSFVDQDGKAMTGGYIYIGKPNTNPETNAIPVFWDGGLTIPAAQPIRTIGGYPSRNGSPGRIFAGQAYSISVRTSDKTLVYTANRIDPNSSDEYATVAAMLADNIGYSAPATIIRVAGDRIFADQYWYEVAPSATPIVSGYPLLAAGGVKLYVLAGENGNDIRAWGAPCDGVNDDTAAINAAVLAVAKSGQGRIVYPAGGSVKILGTVFVVKNCTHDLNGCVITGGGHDANYVFTSGYLSGGALATNVGTAPESHVIEAAQVCNGVIRDCRGGFNFQNLNMLSSVSGVKVYNAPRFGIFDRCFYIELSELYHSGGTSISAPSFGFPSAANAITMRKVITTAEWCYHFVDASAISMIGCTQEGGSVGLKIDGVMLGLTVTGNYAEAVSTWMDLSGATHVNFNIAGNYFNYVDKVYTSGTATPSVFGNWDASNSIVNINGVIGSTTYRGLMEVGNRLNFVKYTLLNNDGHSLTIPANWLVSSNTDISFTSVFTATSVTDYRRKAVVGGGLVPLRFSGDVGRFYAGYVPFCTVTVGATTTIDTKIVWRPLALFAKFDLKAQDGNGFHNLFGDIYGENLKRQDSDAMVMSISDNGGFLRISLTQTAPPLVGVTGSVQICS
jgi:hypothetical protein